MDAMMTGLAVFGGVFLVLLVLVLFLGLWSQTSGYGEDGVAYVEKVELGGVEQWISVRGRNGSNPILVWLHGGPGAAQMPLAHKLDEELEKDFLVVHWDQRGAGKSNHRFLEGSELVFDRFVEDAYELCLHLAKEFDREKVFVLGHSWGSMIGLRLADEHPELFHAYIGVGQVVDTYLGNEMACDWLEEVADDRSVIKRAEKLKDKGAGGWNHEEYYELMDIVNSLGGGLDVPFWRLALMALSAPEYRLWDYLRYLKGYRREGKPLFPEGVMLKKDFPDKIPSLEVPAFFLNGEDDRLTPLELVEDYFKNLNAPDKGLVSFRDCGHLPFVAENLVFSFEVEKIKMRVLGSKKPD